MYGYTHEEQRDILNKWTSAFYTLRTIHLIVTPDQIINDKKT